MSKWQKMAGLFIVGVKDFEFSQDLEVFLKEFPVCGLAFFNSPHDASSNIWSDPKTALECYYEFIWKASKQELVFSLDQEGGRVRRLRKPFIQLPSAQTIGEALEQEKLDRDCLFQIYRLVAEQLRLAGIHLNFGPVVDVRSENAHDVIGDRSFSMKMNTVAELSKIFCEAFQSGEVHTCLKHMPGHGSALFDSHERIAVLQKTKEEVLQTDFKVFQELGSYSSAVMSSHTAFADTPDRIFSLDEVFVDEFRRKLPTHIKVISDDLLSMKAVAERNPAWSVLRAGHDIALLCGDLDAAVKQIEFCIKKAEDENFGFSEEQEWERKILHAKEAFFESIELPDYKSWSSSVTDLTEEYHRLIEAEGLSECFET